MKRFVFCALAGVMLGTAACDGGSPIAPSATEVARNLPPLDPDCCGDGGGGDTGGGDTTPPPAPQYRVHGEEYKIESGPQESITRIKIRGWSRFEQYVGGTWVKVTADKLEVACSAIGAYDEDDEDGDPAGFVDVEFWTGPARFGAIFPVTCTHKAVFRGVTYNLTTTSNIQII